MIYFRGAWANSDYAWPRRTDVTAHERRAHRNTDSSPKGKRPAPPAPDERDATIERLERTLGEERQNSATLRETVDGLHFKAEVLEKGYSKQLADARLRSEKRSASSPS